MAAKPTSFPIRVFDVLTSTNDSILELGANDDVPEWTTHIARRQTHGRGREDRRWWSPEGCGLWMSTLLRPRQKRQLWSGISLLAGRAVKDALSELGVCGVELYWPNDLQVGKRKLGGILGEVRQAADRAWLALGIGVNVDLTRPAARESLPPDVASLATSMAECGVLDSHDVVSIAQAILRHLQPLYEHFQAGKTIPHLVGTELAHVGRRVVVRSGGQTWSGVVRGLGTCGELLIDPAAERDAAEGAASTVRLTGGEVFYGDSPQDA